MAKNWYVLKVQSGREDAVKESLVKRVKEKGMEDLVSNIIVPSEKVSEVKKKRRKIRDKKIYPGYMMIEMEVNDDTWYLVKGTPGVGDFVGPYRKPVPMKEEEVRKIMADAERKEEQPKPVVGFKKGDSVRVKEGPFENFDGVVDEVMPSKGLVKVIVTIFGRATPIELEYWQVESI